jgi:hypothetical protein
MNRDRMRLLLTLPRNGRSMPLSSVSDPHPAADESSSNAFPVDRDQG